MKKQIGTKLYDTETSEFIANVGLGNIDAPKSKTVG